MNYSSLNKLFDQDIGEYDSSQIKDELINYIKINFSDSYWIIDKDFVFRFLSNDFMDYSIDQILGSKFTDLLPEYEKEIFADLHDIEQLITDQQQYLRHLLDLRMLKASGEPTHVEIFSIPFVDEQNKVQGIAGGFRHLETGSLNNLNFREQLYNLRDITDNLKTGFFRTTQDGRIIYANEYMAKALGYDSAEKLTDSEKNINDIAANLQRRKDTIEELEGIFDNSLTGIMVMDENRIMKKVNHQICEIFGYRKEELIDQSSEKLHISHKAYIDFYHYYEQVIKHGTVKNAEGQFKHKNGQEIILRFNGKLLNTKHKTNNTFVIWNLQDITESVRNRLMQDTIYKISQTLHKDAKLSDLLEETRRHLSEILKVDNFMIALYDEARDAFTLPLMADSYDAFTSYDAAHTISRLVVKNNTSYFLKSSDIQKLIDKGEIKVKGTLAKVWIGVPMRVKEKPIGVIVVQDYDDESAFDEENLHMLEFLSEQISMAIIRKNNEEQLKENVETKNKFFSIIAHDLKSPFNSLIGLSSLLEQGILKDEEERMEIYRNLHDTSKEGYALLDNLLLWTRSQIGRVEHNETRFNLRKHVQTVFSLLENNANLKQINLENNVSEVIEVIGDQNKIQTIIRNLVSNAIKYSYPGSSVRVDAEFEKQDLIISVHDKGTGISEDIVNKLFSPGTDFKRQGTNKERGTGLGLLISREFVEQHNGRIWVESEKGEGSRFYFSIPFKKQKQKKYEGVEQRISNTAEKPKGHVLVVEDVKVNYLLLKKLLQNMNLDVSHAEDGKQAVDFVEKQKPDLILMDINMPVMTGIEATQIIKQRYPDIPVVIQTAYTSEENKKASRDAGADDYLEKPIMKEKLEVCIQSFLS